MVPAEESWRAEKTHKHLRENKRRAGGMVEETRPRQNDMSHADKQTADISHCSQQSSRCSLAAQG